jgi:hypothetical protein
MNKLGLEHQVANAEAFASLEAGERAGILRLRRSCRLTRFTSSFGPRGFSWSQEFA